MAPKAGMTSRFLRCIFTGRSRPSRCRLVLVAMLSINGCGGGSSLAPVEDAASLKSGQATAVVTAGDTLYAFAWRYGFDYRELARWNGLAPPYALKTGQRLRLGPPAQGKSLPARAQAAVAIAAPSAARPNAGDPAPVKAMPPPVVAKPIDRTPKPTASKPTQETTTPEPAPSAKTAASTPPALVTPKAWQWPAEGTLTRRFQPGKPGGNGIDIAAANAAKVRATADGKVVYQGSGLPGYGRLIIVKHSESLLSAYGYLGKTYVAEGDFVRGGQEIALMGRGSGYSKPVVHFEIRHDGRPRDPLSYLPGRG